MEVFMSHVIWLLGYPGSGKGTQGKRICETLGCPSIIMGDLCRNHKAQGGEIGRIIQEYSGPGKLVPDDIALHRIYRPVLDTIQVGMRLDDGMPRNLDQYLQMLVWNNERKDGDIVVFWIVVKREKAAENLRKRRREGETEEVIQERLNTYEEEERKLLPRLRDDARKGIIRLIEIDGMPPEEIVFDSVYDELQELGLVPDQEASAT